MSDILEPFLLPGTSGSTVERRLKDMGDGTYADVFASVPLIGGASASSSNPMPVTIISGGVTLADMSVVDAAGVYWLVRDNGTTLTYVNWSTGVAGTPTTPVSPAGKLTGEQIINTQYNVTTAGTGYAVGDVLAHIMILNISTSPATVVSSVWANLTQSSVLSAAPASSSISEISDFAALTLISSPWNATTSAGLSGTISDTSAHTLGPFTPQLARDIWLTLNATVAASGTAQLLRSIDGGTTKLAVTAGGSVWGSYSFTGKTGVIVNEQVATETSAAATYYLAVTLTAGTITYNLGQ